MFVEMFQIYGVRLLEKCICESKNWHIFSYYPGRGKLRIPQAGFLEKLTSPLAQQKGRRRRKLKSD